MVSLQNIWKVLGSRQGSDRNPPSTPYAVPSPALQTTEHSSQPAATDASVVTEKNGGPISYLGG